MLVWLQPAALATWHRRKPGKEQFFHAVTQAQERRVGMKGRREGIPPRKGLLNSAGPSNPSSGAWSWVQVSSLNTSYVSSPVLLGLGLKITATACMLLLLAGTELIQVSLPKLRANLNEFYFAVWIVHIMIVYGESLSSWGKKKKPT